MGFLDDMFGGGDSADEANQYYQKYSQKAIDEYMTSLKQGRGDISSHWQQALGFSQPYRQAGTQALAQYQASLGMTPQGAGAPGSDQGLVGPGTTTADMERARAAGTPTRQSVVSQFRQSPGYQFALKQGQQALQRQASATGMAGGGAEEKALQNYSQNTADQEFGQYQQRLAGLAGAGQQAAMGTAQQAIGVGGSLANLGYQYAMPIGQAYTGMGQSGANAIMAQGAQNQQGFGSLMGGLGSLAGMAFGGPMGAAVGGSLGSMFGGGGGGQAQSWMNPDTGQSEWGNY